LLTKGEQYTDQGQNYYEQRYRQRVIRQLAKRAEQLGLALVPSDSHQAPTSPLVLASVGVS
jgi:hypothetical protein